MTRIEFPLFARNFRKMMNSSKEKFRNKNAKSSKNPKSDSIGTETSHIACIWKWVCAYMYIRTLLETMCFKAVMAMNLSELYS
jgi:hypothetical protein